MNYIGSKQKLAPWIKSVIEKVYPAPLEEAVFADIFAGTGQVARHFKSSVKQVIVNDLESYSFVLNSHYIGNTQELVFPDLSSVNPNVANVAHVAARGLFYKEFSPASTLKRMYFTEDNALRIDAYRTELERQYTAQQISLPQYHWALASLIEAADAVANTASVYGAFLKKFKINALKTLALKPVAYDKTGQINEVYQSDANELVKKIKGDILYLDPPYNHRQYGANYHVLNKIVDYQDFSSTRITGLTDYNKSNYCKKDKVYAEFEALISAAQFKYIFISYNNEGLIPEGEFKALLSKYGEYHLEKKEYKRYKADAARPGQAPTTFEHLHVLIKK